MLVTPIIESLGKKGKTASKDTVQHALGWRHQLTAVNYLSPEYYNTRGASEFLLTCVSCYWHTLCQNLSSRLLCTSCNARSTKKCIGLASEVWELNRGQLDVTFVEHFNNFNTFGGHIKGNFINLGADRILIRIAGRPLNRTCNRLALLEFITTLLKTLKLRHGKTW